MLCVCQKYWGEKRFAFSPAVGNSDSSNFSPCSTCTSVTHIKCGFPQQINITVGLNEREGERRFDRFNWDNYTVLSLMFFLIQPSKSKHNLATLFNIKRTIKFIQGLNLRPNSGRTCGSAACWLRWITATTGTPSPISSPSSRVQMKPHYFHCSHPAALLLHAFAFAAFHISAPRVQAPVLFWTSPKSIPGLPLPPSILFPTKDH